MFENIEGVLFDLDGTLVDSMWLWEAIDIDFLKKYNLDLPEDLVDDIEGKSFTETATYFKNRFGLKETVAEIKTEWNAMALDYYTNKVPLKEGVLDLLDYLKEKNIPMGIGTSNSRDLVDIVLKKLNIDHYFDSVRTSCEVKKGKPSPDIYLQVAKDLKVNPEKCLVFEDVVNGIIAGKKAGAKVCAVYDEHTEGYTEAKIKLADYYIENYNELFTIEEGLRNEA
ncbi:HAD superfamily hydrolase (TIGR01509 family)/HAD superfamily hydrolase (TIGR01549 family) [Natranaerovirga hydrolytica]|uniref:HAD superfamily hydrolase (TIGR01509 family)/HAD superfamily hydrolase (TIGR01549 family) n=1 Tax=Natranaerovirga hydrolytica TaxID=680378 RepID=A0A4R1MYQ5_9FIRM|nr:HAD family phosphatase [Natranaerovirga hydrolytica]TCK98275.1 HAD superfamily hydrolase (TIGR01509 family)/HAD superfamily hydrolase (TIGR01549 family) [Natranaerovirga hydrolytica]